MNLEEYIRSCRPNYQKEVRPYFSAPNRPNWNRILLLLHIAKKKKRVKPIHIWDCQAITSTWWSRSQSSLAQFWRGSDGLYPKRKVPSCQQRQSQLIPQHIMNSLRIARSALRVRSAAIIAPVQRRGYADVVSDKVGNSEQILWPLLTLPQIKLSLVLPHQVCFIRVQLDVIGICEMVESCDEHGWEGAAAQGRMSRKWTGTNWLTGHLQVKRCRPSQHSCRVRRYGYPSKPRSIHRTTATRSCWDHRGGWWKQTILP